MACHTIPSCHFLVVSFLLLALLVVSIAGDNTPNAADQTWLSTTGRRTRESISDLRPQFARQLNRFGLQLFARLDSDNKDNVVISPLSVASVLTMLVMGVTKGSSSEEQLRSLIGKGFSSPSGATDPAVKFKVANSIWTTSSVLRGYEKRVMRALSAKICPLPSDVAVINKWVSNATNGNIPSILNEIPEQTIALLINAIFFKAAWQVKFDPRNTTNEDFYGPKGKGKSPVVANVKMMKLKDERFRYAEVRVNGEGKASAHVVELPYGNGKEYAATIIVPTESTTLEEVIQPFRSGVTHMWDRWMEALLETRIDLLSLPRFMIEFGVESLIKILQDMGLNAPFNSAPLKPQLLRLTPDKRAYVSDILHKATLEVTEEGSKASAATVAIVETKSLRPNVKIVANRPFLFAIRNVKSGTLLFIAKVDKPRSASSPL